MAVSWKLARISASWSRRACTTTSTASNWKDDDGQASSAKAARGHPRSSPAAARADQETDAEREGRRMTAKSTPEVSDVLTEMPRWAARGLLYLLIAFVGVGLMWAHF